MALQLISSNILTHTLVHIINLIFKAGEVPELLKKTVIAPILKAKERASIEYFKPLSIINNFASVELYEINKSSLVNPPTVVKNTLTIANENGIQVVYLIIIFQIMHECITFVNSCPNYNNLFTIGCSLWIVLTRY